MNSYEQTLRLFERWCKEQLGIETVDNVTENYKSDYILGNIHKVKEIQDYVDYVQQAFNDPPGLMFMYAAENCLAMDGNDRQIMYEDTGKLFVNVIFDDTSDQLDFVWKPAPKNRPDWSQLP